LRKQFQLLKSEIEELIIFWEKENGDIYIK
jgi:hypothetical protein